MMQLMKRFAREEDGVTAIEYGLIAALIALVVAVPAITVGTDLTTTFNTIANCLTTKTAATC